MLGQQGRFPQSGAACEQAEAEAVRLANEMQAEYWSVSAKTGEWLRGCRRGLAIGGGARPVRGRSGTAALSRETPTPARGQVPADPAAPQAGRGSLTWSSLTWSRSVGPPPTRCGREAPPDGVARTVSTNRG